MAAENDNAKSQENRGRFNQEQYDILMRCSAKQDMTEWDTYRAEHPKTWIQLEYAELAGVNLWKANLLGSNLLGANLWGANLSRANLLGAYLKSANLGGANLEGAILVTANLSHAILVEANLEGADLEGANLWGANLSHAILVEANLEGADLLGAKFEGTKLRGANLTSANLGRAIPVRASHATEQVELVINLADDITYEEVVGLLKALKGLSVGIAGIVPHLNEIKIGQHTGEHAAWEGGN